MYSTEWTAIIRFNDDGEKQSRRLRVTGSPITATEARNRIRAGVEREYPGAKFSIGRLTEHIYDRSN